MANWRHYILQHFQEPLHRLTLVADPDGLMLEEKLLAAIRQNGFELLPFEDHVAFRYAYESHYRRYWDDGHDTDLVVILRSPEASLHALPYDLLQAGRMLTFRLPDLFPRLSYPVVSELDVADLQRLYEATHGYTGPEMGDRASALFVLQHVFGIVPDKISAPASLLKLLLSRHARRERVPPRLDALLLESLRRHPAFEAWPLETMLHNAADFLAFLQARWGNYLAARQPAEVLAREPGATYHAGDLLPFEDADVHVYVDTLFLEGKLKPVSLPEGWTVEGWAQVGIEVDEQAFELRRLTGLLERLEAGLPATDASHKDWLSFAARWAELTILHHRLVPGLDAQRAARYRTLHLRLEERFAEWMHMRYHTLHSLPFVPQPVMVHHIAHHMAAHRTQYPESRLALVVVDGLALDQWLIIRDVWSDEPHGWSVQEGAVFAWVPTLTSISRQAILAGAAPQFFPNSWATTGQEASHWRRFWRERGLGEASVGYLRNLGVKDLSADGSLRPDGEGRLEPEVEALIGNHRTQAVGLVINTVDNILHGMQLGTAGMHQQVQLWHSGHRYLTRLVDRLLEASFTVYLTSDHGNVSALGIGQIREGVLVEKRSQRARVYDDAAFVALAAAQSPTAVEWTNVGLPEPLKVLLAPQLDAFLDAGQRTVCHGGMALEEVIVPFVQISGITT
ncbi:MAG: BREX-3 system phosphatase PglZ [Chloroflexota bacterium]